MKNENSIKRHKVIKEHVKFYLIIIKPVFHFIF